VVSLSLSHLCLCVWTLYISLSLISHVSPCVQVPADIALVFANECKVDNSSLTGESEPVDRTNVCGVDHNGGPVTTAFEANNLCFFTTIVVTGNCKGVVIGTADNTAMGQIAGLTTETTNDASPIATEIAKFIHLISAVAIVLVRETPLSALHMEEPSAPQRADTDLRGPCLDRALRSSSSAPCWGQRSSPTSCS
jgi:P-type E1-E2 ATPase